MDDDEGEVPFEVFVGSADGLDEIALVMALDEVDNDLGVGLGAERVPVRLERLLDLAVVLDDPVQDDRELPLLAAGKRVRILFADAAVRCPARVPDPRRGLGAVPLRGLLQVLEIADRADVVEAVILEQRKAGRVVAPVFEALEALDQKRLARSRPDVSDDSAHSGSSFPRLRSSDARTTLSATSSRNARKPGIRDPLHWRSVNRALVEREPKWYHRARGPRRNLAPPPEPAPPALFQRNGRALGRGLRARC